MVDPLTLDAAAPLLTPHTIEENLPALRGGGVDAVLATVASVESAEYALERIARWLELERESELPIRLVRTTKELRGAKKRADIGVVLHIQGTDPLDGDLELLTAFHRLGVRVVQLTYNEANRLGDGCLESRDAGLTSFGEEVIGRLVDLGIVVDISHAGIRTSLEAVAAAKMPVVATHANARAVCDHPRNLTDEQIRSVAGSGGVIGLCAFPAFVSEKAPTLDDLVDHAEYIGDLVGPEHLGLGLDFAEEDEEDYDFYGYDERYYPRPPWVYPTGIRSFSDLPNVAEALLGRRFTEDEVRGILGENFLRVFRLVWGG
ncbi:MAG: dipeptidase [Gemmatimonadota bacterium]